MTLEQILTDNETILFPRIYTVHGADRDPESGLNIDEALSRVTEDETDGPYTVDYDEPRGHYVVVNCEGRPVRGGKFAGGTMDEAMRRYMSGRALDSRGIYDGPFISTDADYDRVMAEAIAADEA